MSLILRLLFAYAIERAVIKPKPRLRAKPMTEVFTVKPKIFMAPVGTSLGPDFGHWPKPWDNISGNVKGLEITHHKKEYVWV